MYALRLLCTKLSTSSAAKRFRPEWWSLSASGCWSLRYICRLPQFATDVLRPWRGSTTRLIPGSTEDLSKAALRHLWSHKGVTKVEAFLLQPIGFSWLYTLIQSFNLQIFYSNGSHPRMQHRSLRCVIRLLTFLNLPHTPNLYVAVFL